MLTFTRIPCGVLDISGDKTTAPGSNGTARTFTLKGFSLFDSVVLHFISFYFCCLGQTTVFLKSLSTLLVAKAMDLTFSKKQFLEMINMRIMRLNQYCFPVGREIVVYQHFSFIF